MCSALLLLLPCCRQATHFLSQWHSLHGNGSLSLIACSILLCRHPLLLGQHLLAKEQRQKDQKRRGSGVAHRRLQGRKDSGNGSGEAQVPAQVVHAS